MKIVLLSDLHLTNPGKLTKEGFDVNQQFLNIVEDLKSKTFDRIIILGDICYKEGEYEIYDWFFDQIEALNKPFDLISGIHDDSELLIKILDQPTADTYDHKIFYTKEIAGFYCIFLDTSEGFLKGKQLEWFENKLFELDRRAIIFMHHPPCNGGVPFMDSQHYLGNRREIIRKLRNLEHRVDVFSGHYHVDKDLQFNNCHVHICPSPFFTLDQSTSEFVIEHRNACYKILSIDKGEINLKSVYL